MIINREKRENDGIEVDSFEVEVKDKIIRVEKIRELIESKDFLDKEGKFDTDTFLEEIENRRTYLVEITKKGNKIIKRICTCRWGSLEEARTKKTNIDCRHIKLCLGELK